LHVTSFVTGLSTGCSQATGPVPPAPACEGAPPKEGAPACGGAPAYEGAPACEGPPLNEGAPACEAAPACEEAPPDEGAPATSPAPACAEPPPSAFEPVPVEPPQASGDNPSDNSNDVRRTPACLESGVLDNCVRGMSAIKQTTCLADLTALGCVPTGDSGVPGPWRAPWARHSPARALACESRSALRLRSGDGLLHPLGAADQVAQGRVLAARGFFDLSGGGERALRAAGL